MRSCSRLWGRTGTEAKPDSSKPARGYKNRNETSWLLWMRVVTAGMCNLDGPVFGGRLRFVSYSSVCSCSPQNIASYVNNIVLT